MLALFEIPEGFALFDVVDDAKVSLVELSSTGGSRCRTPVGCSVVELEPRVGDHGDFGREVKLKASNEFESTLEALKSKPYKALRRLLRTHCKDKALAVSDPELGNAIQEKLNIECTNDIGVMELLRKQISTLIPGLSVQCLSVRRMGLPGYKLQSFSPYKDDRMIIQAIGFLDDHDKNLNAYAMKVREWYGWHFPELTEIVKDNIQYAKIVKQMGSRVNAADHDFSEILPKETEAEVKKTAAVSKGTDISNLDLVNIAALCDQVLALAEYRPQLYDYLRSRMNTIAPNLTALVGELVGARLIAQTGSLLNLVKQPAGTLHNLGADETERDARKHGFIFQTSLVDQAAPEFKMNICRPLSAKCALAARYDAFSDTDGSFGRDSRAELEDRLRDLKIKAAISAMKTALKKSTHQPKQGSKKKKQQGSGKKKQQGSKPTSIKHASIVDHLHQGVINEDKKKKMNNVIKLDIIDEHDAMSEAAQEQEKMNKVETEGVEAESQYRVASFEEEACRKEKRKKRKHAQTEASSCHVEDKKSKNK